jgi:pilus assembly protein CpaC
MLAQSFKIKLILFLMLLTHLAHAETNLVIPLNQGRYIKTQDPLDTIFVANPDIIDYHLRSPHQLYVFAKSVGSTSLYIKSEKDPSARHFRVQVLVDTSSTEKLIHRLFPTAHIQIIPINQEALAIKGMAATPSDAQSIIMTVSKILKNGDKDIINLIKVNSPTQVNLRVEIVELSRQLKRQYGVDWLLGDASSAQLQATLLPDAFIPPIASQVAFRGLLKSGNFNLTAALHFLEENNLATILSEPNLTAQSGETASFLVGGEFPVISPGGIGQSPNVTYKKYGVALDFAPTVLTEKRIHLQIRSEVSEISNNPVNGAVEIAGTHIPALTTRQASTAIELKSGQSFAIAGLLQNNANKLLKELPGIAKTPILGALFRSQQFQRQETELIILVTPYLVSPAGANQLTQPLKGLVKENPATRHAARCQGTGCDQNLGFLKK